MHISGAQLKKATAGQNSGKKEELFRMECSTLPLAGRGETHTMKEWKRIYGYEQGYMFAGKFIKVEASPAPAPAPVKHESKVDAFYNDPTPANAVALAIADAKAEGNGTPEFFHYLAKAERQTRAFAAMLDALKLAHHNLAGTPAYDDSEVDTAIKDAITAGEEAR